MTRAGFLVVTGVSGAGKTTVAEGIAHGLQLPMIDADDLHPESNRRKMSAGVPLTDEDRWPWLDAVRETAHWYEGRGGVVVACSALRRAYRDRLSRDGARPYFICLNPSERELRRRLAGRTGHFMPPSLLASQLETLELPGLDEPGIRLDGDRSVEETVATAVTLLRAGNGARREG